MKGAFRSFFCTEKGYGLVGVEEGQPFAKAVSGRFSYKRIDYKPAH